MIRKKVKFENINTIEFCIDENNKDVIVDFLQEKGHTKLQYIIQQIANKTATKNVYSSENYNNDIKNITAIKFKGKAFNNARIYCKDYKKNEKRIIILCELLPSKKQDKLTRIEKNLIQKVNDYEY